jgi:hypothetical protein
MEFVLGFPTYQAGFPDIIAFGPDANGLTSLGATESNAGDISGHAGVSDLSITTSLAGSLSNTIGFHDNLSSGVTFTLNDFAPTAQGSTLSAAASEPRAPMLIWLASVLVGAHTTKHRRTPRKATE